MVAVVLVMAKVALVVGMEMALVAFVAWHVAGKVFSKLCFSRSAFILSFSSFVTRKKRFVN